jgi:hypothetical protein
MQRILIGGGLVLVLALVLAGGYLALNTGATATDSANKQAAQAFLTERAGDGPTLVFSDTVQGAGANGPPPGAVGTVRGIDGNRITVQNPMDGQTTTILVGDNTTIHKQAPGTTADLTPGTAVTVFGPRTGDSVTAQAVQIGAGGPGSGAPMQITMNGPGPGGAGPGTASGMVQPVIGTVASLDGTHLVVQAGDGSKTTVELPNGVSIVKTVTGQLADIQPGQLVIAQGTSGPDGFAATDIQLATAQVAPMRQP